jgi:hypothetical protein
VSPVFLTKAPFPTLMIEELPDPITVRIAEIVVGEVGVTTQNSVFTVPSSSWYTTV